ncbi:MAG: hypothetical protein IIZ78_29550 [Clostridiales bacterium]|nr:hypothetical protein [Clostridiales bacterium]MBQ1575299.1 hypothetical protein [Clostridiales bacterium]
MTEETDTFDTKAYLEKKYRDRPDYDYGSVAKLKNETTDEGNNEMYYRKEGFIMGEDNRPDFKQMYENKALEKAEYQAEYDTCWRIVKEAIELLEKTMIEYPKDVAEIEKTARFCAIWMKKRIGERNFKRLNKHDIGRIWETALKDMRKRIGC